MPRWLLATSMFWAPDPTFDLDYHLRRHALGGSHELAAYPFAPVALKSPASVALYGYRDRLFIGIDADEAVMPDVEAFERMIVEAFEDLRAAAG